MKICILTPKYSRLGHAYLKFDVEMVKGAENPYFAIMTTQVFLPQQGKWEFNIQPSFKRHMKLRFITYSDTGNG